LHLIAESSIYVENSNFVGGHALVGGAIYILGDSSAHISSSKFTDNVAEKRGGAICAESFASLTVANSCTFYNNEAYNETGDAIYGLSSMNSVSISLSTFFRTKASNFISFQDIETIIISGITVKLSDGATNIVSKASGVIISNTKNLTILDSNFENLMGNSDLGGGAILISETANSKRDSNSFVIGNSVFKNCQNVNGGAIGIVDAAHVKINNTKFIQNKATKSGGAVYFKCLDYGLNYNKCKLSINNTEFTLNNAGVEGGSIKWNFYEPTFKSITYSKNTAGIYGTEIASVAKKLIRIE